MIKTLIISLILGIIVGWAIGYIRKEHKKGNKCIGCPYSEQCQKYKDRYEKENIEK